MRPATPATTMAWCCATAVAPMTPATRPKFAVSPSLNPYTTLRRKPPDSVRCHGSALFPLMPASSLACSADSRASSSASPPPGAPRRRPLVKVQVALHLASFLAEEVRKQEARPEPPPQPCEQPSARGGTERPRRVTQLGEQLRPDLDVSVFDRGEACVDVRFFGSGSTLASARYRNAASASSCQWCSKAWTSGGACVGHAVKYDRPR